MLRGGITGSTGFSPAIQLSFNLTGIEEALPQSWTDVGLGGEFRPPQ